MSVFSLLWCLLNRHNPMRRDVAWNGMTYAGKCRHCGAEIERFGHRDWRKVGSSAGRGQKTQS